MCRAVSGGGAQGRIPHPAGCTTGVHHHRHCTAAFAVQRLHGGQLRGGCAHVHQRASAPRAGDKHAMCMSHCIGSAPLPCLTIAQVMAAAHLQLVCDLDLPLAEAISMLLQQAVKQAMKRAQTVLPVESMSKSRCFPSQHPTSACLPPRTQRCVHVCFGHTLKAMSRCSWFPGAPPAC